jgi:hypothetical protein
MTFLENYLQSFIQNKHVVKLLELFFPYEVGCVLVAHEQHWSYVVELQRSNGW